MLQTNTERRRNGRRYFKRMWSHLKQIGLGLSLIVLLILTATPVYVYYLVPNTSSSETSKSTSCQVVPTILLNRSVCRSVFPHWSVNKNNERNISVSGCGNFSKVEKDLKRLAVHLLQLSDGIKLRSLLCHYAFNDCGSNSSNEQNICLELSKFQNEIRRLMPFLENVISCLTIPRCANILIEPNDSRISNETQCPKPLIPTRSKYARERGFYCSPPCDQSHQNRFKSYFIAMYVSVPIHVISLAILFITWAKAKGLLSYQSITGLFLTASVTVFDIAVILPLLLGQNRSYCKYKSVIDSWLYSTTICHAQGILFQFGYLSLICWWASSVSNTVLTVWKPRQFSRESHKRIFLVQLTLWLIISGGPVAFALLHGMKYGRLTPYTITCCPESDFWEFYLFSLPADITLFCGTLMSIFVMAKLNQAERLSLRGTSAGKRYKTTEAYGLVQKRFLSLSVLLPLTVATSMATSEIYAEKLSRKYFKCLNDSDQGTTNSCTYEEELDPGWITALINWILADLCVLALVAYCLIPLSARAFWSQIWRECKKRQRKSRRYDYDDTIERPSEVSRLFPSSTSSQGLYSVTETS